MEWLGKIFNAIRGFFSRKNISIESNKDTRKNIIKGDNNGIVVNGDMKVGSAIKVSEEEPEDQDEEDMWLKIIK